MTRPRMGAAERWGGQAILVALVAFTLLPFLGLASVALRAPHSLLTGLTLPRSPHPENFLTAIEAARLPTLMGSSLLLIAMVVPLAVLLSTTAAYGLTVLRAPGGDVILGLLMVGMAIPIEALVIPLYHLMRAAGLLNTRPAIALPLTALYLPFGIYWMRAHFLGVPPAATEAATLDGAGPWTTLVRIHLPLARPAMAMLGLLLSLWTWNHFTLGLVMMGDPLKRTMAGALAAFQGQYDTDLPLLAAGALLVVAPVVVPTIVVFTLFRRWLATALLRGSSGG